jgi:hypothetical protein
MISIPRVRAYYPASKNEPDRLLCWIPTQELETMVEDGQVRSDILEDYPDGLEVEVSEQAFDEFELDLGVEPDALLEAYANLLERNALPESGRVAGESLEKEASSDIIFAAPMAMTNTKLPEPDMTDGQDAQTVMQLL